MNVSLFQPCSVDYGGRMHRGMSCTCGKCGGISKVPMNTSPTGGGNDDLQVERMAMRKFSNLGWEIGKQPARHRCPSCVKATKPFADLINLNKPKEDTMPNGMLPPLTPKPADPVKLGMVSSPTMGPSFRTMAAASVNVGTLSRDDRRIIFAKLNDCYDSERTGYRGGWTDTKVARDLGVPVEWVSQVREDLLGPDTNLAAAEQIAASKEVVAKITALLDEVKALTDKVEPLKTMLAQHQADIEALQKQVAA